MSIRTLSFVVVKVVGSIGLGCAVLGYVASQAGPRICHVVIHVVETDVDVWVDEDRYPFESPQETPLALTLQPGQHALLMSREGRTLCEQSFFLRPGENLVLTAWDQNLAGRSDP